MLLRKSVHHYHYCNDIHNSLIKLFCFNFTFEESKDLITVFPCLEQQPKKYLIRKFG